MKKLAILLSFIISVAFNVSLKAATVDGINYTLYRTEAYVTGISSDITSSDIIIPETIVAEGFDYTVTRINTGAFNDSRITSVSIPATVTTIQSGSFNGVTLNSLTFKESDTPINFPDQTSRTSVCQNCTVKNIYIGRTLTFGINMSLLDNKSYFGTVEFAENIKRLPDRIFYNSKIINDLGGTFNIPEGIEELGLYSLEITNLEYLVFPSSLKKLNSPLNTSFNDELYEIILESKAKEPMIYEYPDCRPFNGLKFIKLIVPHNCTQIYLDRGWGVLSDEIKEAEPESDNTEYIFVKLMIPNTETGYFYPKFEVEAGSDFSIICEIEPGWTLSRASFEPESNLNSPKKEADASSQVLIEKMDQPNHFKISIAKVSSNGTLNYVMEKETSTVINSMSFKSKPVIKVAYGIISIVSPEDAIAGIYNLKGELISSTRILKDVEAIINNLSSGIYIIKVGENTYKLAI